LKRFQPDRAALKHLGIAHPQKYFADTLRKTSAFSLVKPPNHIFHNENHSPNLTKPAPIQPFRTPGLTENKSEKP
jgi:hypothetical protein